MNYLLAYFVFTTTALVVYILWREAGLAARLRVENDKLRDERDAYRKALFTVGNLPTAPFAEKQAGVARTAEPTEDSEPLTAESWENSLGNADWQAYQGFKAIVYDELALKDPDEVFEEYQKRYGLQSPFGVMKMG